MIGRSVPLQHDAGSVNDLLDSPEVATLIADLDATRWTGRPGYPIRAMVGMALIKSIYAIPVWTRVVRLAAEHDEIQRVLGCAPSLDACYRFARKLRELPDALANCIDSVIAGLRDANPEMGTQVAIDGSDLPAYANGQRFVFNHGPKRKVFSDPDAVMGPPFSDLNPQGRRVLRVQGPRRGGRCDRTADRMESGDGLTSRSSTGARLARHNHSPRVQDDNRHSRPWVQQRPRSTTSASPVAFVRSFHSARRQP